MEFLTSFLKLLWLMAGLQAAIATSDYNTTDDVYYVQTGKFQLWFEFSPAKTEQLEQEAVQKVTVNVTLRRLNDMFDDVMEGDNSSMSDTGGATDDDYIAMLFMKMEHSDIAELLADNVITDNSTRAAFLLYLPSTQPEAFFSFTVAIRGVFLGRTFISFSLGEPDLDYIQDSNQTVAPPILRILERRLNIDKVMQLEKLPFHYLISIIRPLRLLDRIFNWSMSVFVLACNIGMGCKIDLQVIKRVMKRPLAPALGFVSQFGCMPITAYGITRLLRLRGGLALGFFTSGCAPGGGASNMYTLLLNGDVSLSVTMTFVSMTASLGMIPLWMFTLGERIMKDADADIKIPYKNILMTLGVILVPIAIGLFIQIKKPAIAKKIVKSLKPVYLIFMIYFLTMGIYTNLYLFRLFSPIMAVAACMLPYIGFTIGAIVSTISCQPFHRKIAMTIETGLQSTGIPLILLKYSLPQPEADIAIVAPVMISMFTPLPLLLFFIVGESYRFIFKKEGRFFQKVPQDDSEEKEVDGKEDVKETKDTIDQEILEEKPVQVIRTGVKHNEEAAAMRIGLLDQTNSIESGDMETTDI